MTDYTSWQVGDRVVCVDDVGHDKYTPWPCNSNDLDGLTAGEIYTIRKIAPYGYGGQIKVWLKEIVRPLSGRISRQYGEIGYDPRRFRRVPSIAIFERFLKNADAPIREDA